MENTIAVREEDLNRLLTELAHLRKRVTELQQHATEQLEEIRRLKSGRSEESTT